MTGAYLLGLWGLPDDVVEAVAFHHRPAACPHRAFRPLTAVHVADVIEHETGRPEPLGAAPRVLAHRRAGGTRVAKPSHIHTDPPAPRERQPWAVAEDYLAALGLTGRLPAWRAACQTAARAWSTGSHC